MKEINEMSLKECFELQKKIGKNIEKRVQMGEDIRKRRGEKAEELTVLRDIVSDAFEPFVEVRALGKIVEDWIEKADVLRFEKLGFVDTKCDYPQLQVDAIVKFIRHFCNLSDLPWDIYGSYGIDGEKVLDFNEE